MGVSDGHDLGASLVGVPGTSVTSNETALFLITSILQCRAAHSSAEAWRESCMQQQLTRDKAHVLPIIYHSLSLCFSLSAFSSISLSLSFSHSLSLSFTLTLSHSLTLSLSRPLSLCFSLTLSLPPFPFRSEQGEHPGVRRSDQQCGAELRLGVHGISSQLSHPVPRHISGSFHCACVHDKKHTDTHRGAVHTAAHTG